MFEYLALAHAPHGTQAVQQARLLASRRPVHDSWQTVFENGTLRVFCRPRHLLANHVAARGDLLILGAYFPCGNDLDNPPFPPDGWGDYVAFRTAAACHLHIYREPTATLPCLYVTDGHVQVFASNLSTLRAVTRRRFAASEHYLHHHLLGRIDTLRRSPLLDLTALIGGEILDVDLEQSVSPIRQLHWRPAAFMTAAAQTHDPHAAQELLHDTVCKCTQTWVKHTGTALMRLSGGLDSSIVFGCLAQANAQAILPYVYFNPSGPGTERRWAQSAASLHHRHCLTIPFTPEDIALAKIADLQPTTEPVSTLPYLLRAPIERRLAHQHHATAVFTGQAGDASFCRDCIAQIPLEYVTSHGWSAALIRLCAQVARHTERSFWQIASDLARRRCRTQHPANSADDLPLSQLIDPQVLRTEPPLGTPHPWLDQSNRPATLPRRLGALLAPTEYYDISVPPQGDAPQVISPLLSRPVVEACLRIPSHVHFQAGVERGLARAAFAREVPADIRRRCWKDRAPGFFDQLLALHRSFIREFLLDGLLVRDHWLSRPALESALSASNAGSRTSALEIFNHLDTEAWLRNANQLPGSPERIGEVPTDS